YSLNDTAHAYSMNGQFDRAKEVSIEASTMWRKMNNLPMLADSIAGLAAISVYLGEYDQAYEYSDQAYTISQNINNIWGLSYSRYAIGLVDLERGDFGRAIANFKQTIHDAKISKFRAGEVLSNTFLIVVYSEIGDHKKALSIVEDQRTNIEENLIVTWAFSFGSEVYALAKAGEFDKALKIVKKFRMDIEGTYFIARYYFHLGRAYINLASKDYQAAVDVAEEFLEFTSEIENFYLYPELMLISGIAYMKMGLTKVAMEKFEEGIRVATKLESRKNLWLLKYYQGKQYKENGDDELARESLKQAVENVQYILDHIEDDDLKQFFRSRNDVQELKKFADEMELKEIV
ncbi:MAG: hypothetical protein P8Y68_19610, partial [Anaerolineales bacterium]